MVLYGLCGFYSILYIFHVIVYCFYMILYGLYMMLYGLASGSAFSPTYICEQKDQAHPCFCTNERIHHAFRPDEASAQLSFLSRNSPPLLGNLSVNFHKSAESSDSMSNFSSAFNQSSVTNQSG